MEKYYTRPQLKEIYKALSSPLPKEAIQRTKASETKKGYDTTGYYYQYLVNRFNGALGVGDWSWKFKIFRETAGKYKAGTPFTEITGIATIKVRISDKKWMSHSEPGGHRSSNLADALKGASTNAFKKCAAFYGVGKDAFEGSIDEKGKKYIDEDNRDQGGSDTDIKKITTETTQGKKKISVMDVNKKIDSIDTKDKVKKMEGWLDRNEMNYTPTQANVMRRRLEEQIKTLKK